MQERVLIAGFGYLGRKLAHILIENNYLVYAIKRQKIEDEQNVHLIYSDINNLTADDIPDIDYAFFLLAPNSFNEENYRRTYIDSLLSFCNIMKQKKVKKVIFSSSTSMYEHTDGCIVNEETNVDPQKFPGKIMLEAESILKENCDNPIIARLSGIYGKERGDIYKTLENVANPLFYSNRIHQEDACNALFYLMKKCKTPETIIITDSNPEQYKNIASWLNIEPKINPNPKRFSNKRLSNAKLIATGFKFKYPSYKEGLSDIIRK